MSWLGVNCCSGEGGNGGSALEERGSVLPDLSATSSFPSPLQVAPEVRNGRPCLCAVVCTGTNLKSHLLTVDHAFPPQDSQTEDYGII